jgi:hypothetical protein
MLARSDVRFTIGKNAFDLVASAGLPSGDLTVTDLRGRVVFRSTWNASTGRWSQSAVRNLVHPVYFYSFRGVNGEAFNGRISLASTF